MSDGDDDIVETLRYCAELPDCDGMIEHIDAGVLIDAADEIERLRGALRRIADRDCPRNTASFASAVLGGANV